MKITEIITPDRFKFDLNDIAKDINGTQTFREIIAIVEKHFPIASVKIVRNAELSEGELTIGAHYDPEKDEEGETAVFITIVFSKEGPESFTWNSDSKKYFLNKLKDALKHELLHMKQYRDRDFHAGNDGYDDSDMEHEYMSRPDEIEAYAMNIGDEFIRKVGKDGAVDLLRMAKKTAQFKNKLGQFLSPDLLAYFALFKWDTNHPVIKRLIKKIYQHIQEQ
tara:strand:+ start:3203 stop:3868 length:666 start_codon:yes stop_codon:yes gene_type:complete